MAKTARQSRSRSLEELSLLYRIGQTLDREQELTQRPIVPAEASPQQNSDNWTHASG